MGRGRGSRFWESVLRSCRDRKALKKSEARTQRPGLTLRGGQTYWEACQKCSETTSPMMTASTPHTE